MSFVFQISISRLQSKNYFLSFKVFAVVVKCAPNHGWLLWVTFVINLVENREYQHSSIQHCCTNTCDIFPSFDFFFSLKLRTFVPNQNFRVIVSDKSAHRLYEYLLPHIGVALRPLFANRKRVVGTFWFFFSFIARSNYWEQNFIWERGDWCECYYRNCSSIASTEFSRDFLCIACSRSMR